ncbi:hypothetical protein [Sinisalibacter aestuarii]|uniref:Membrane protein n=1 Tax=Sinisalibacter aestuarii TaxID=2949426 RepID=A0ABQ5LUY4_9RHOB|nr:hypothetical protein [Sinisalibacter aestuarii]GKY88240.1 membrane protein [Sinisalibacter aestuarii]
MSAASLIFAPLFPWPVLWAAAGVIAFLIALGAWRGLKGWPLRALGALALLVALAGPSLQTEERAPLGDILLAVVDESASQGLSDRAAQTEAALAALEREAAGKGLDLRVTRLGDGEDDRGTLAMTALSEALADVPRDRVAGMVLISDGQVHDLEAAPDLPAPLHLLQTGREADWDRRIALTTAPAFAIIGEEQIIQLRVEDLGAAPDATTVRMEISVDGDTPSVHEVPVGRDLGLPITLSHGGPNVVQVTTPMAEGELTDRNNTVVVSVNGVRDRLSVLLVTGLPHPGTRTWRNLLKSDSAVDLVHFTILRPPDKQDGVPVTELSLIAFPTQELFMEKIDEFDLIIFDRYMLRGILPASYLGSVRDYVRRGGAVLVAAGPDYASVESLARSPLGEVLPGLPTSRLIDAPYSPAVTELGARHPVTRGLEAFAPEGGWGRWMRQVEVDVPQGNGMVVMSGADDAPLLMLDRVEAGRVALLASDHAWLWSRGFEGGGPQLELLRRLAHWMMREPELEEEALTATAQGATIAITRRTLGTGARDVLVTGPDGSETIVPLREDAPGLYRAEMDAPAMGLYRLSEGDAEAVVGVGPASPKEFENTIASASVLDPVIAPMGGGALALEDGVPGLRAVRPGRAASGRGWIGYTPRDAYVVEALSITPLAPAWLMLLIAAGLAVLGWLVEGRRRRA